MSGPGCERCGRCLEVCPTYQVTRVETLGPRARYELIEAVRGGTLAGGPRYRHTLSQCLQCLACSRACPKGVDVAGQVVAAREERRAREGGETLKRLGLAAVLRGRPALAALARLARPLAALLPRRPGSPSRHLPLFLPEALAGRAVPPLAPRRLPRAVPAAPGVPPRGPVTLFTGCFFGAVDTGPALAAARALARAGYEVRIPRGQTCCGTPAALSGHRDLARAAARRNLAALTGPGPLVTPCATCGSALRREYPRLAAEGGALAERVRDLSELLGELPAPAGGLGPVAGLGRVTVHDPCHRAEGGAAAVRRLLATVPGLEVVGHEGADRCCGGGGLTALAHPEITGTLGRDKAAAVVASGVDAVVADCPGCLLQLRDVLARAGSTVRVLHPLQVLDQARGGSGG